MSQHKFEALTAKHQKKVKALTHQLVDGSIDPAEFGDALYTLIYNGHADAIALGRAHAGGSGRRTEDDELLAVDQADQETEWLNKFVEDLESGRYTDDEGQFITEQIERRGDMYSVKYRASTNQAFIDNSDENEEWIWKLGPTEHCSDCQDLADASPLSRNELYTTPGASDTNCLLGCACFLIRKSDGKQGFLKP